MVALHLCVKNQVVDSYYFILKCPDFFAGSLKT